MISVYDYAIENNLIEFSAIGGKEFRAFFQEVKMETAVEIGTYKGVSAAYIGQFAEVVHTFDIIDYPEKYKIWYDLKTHNVHFHLVKPRATSINFQGIEPDSSKAQNIEETLNGIDFDIAFIDGTHNNYEEVKADFNLVKRCGRVLFHDATPVFTGVYPLVVELKAKIIGGIAYWEGTE